MRACRISRYEEQRQTEDQVDGVELDAFEPVRPTVELSMKCHNGGLSSAEGIGMLGPFSIMSRSIS